MTFLPDLGADWMRTVISCIFSGFSLTSIFSIIFWRVLWVVMYHWSWWSSAAICSCFFFWEAYLRYSFSMRSSSSIFFMMKSE